MDRHCPTTGKRQFSSQREARRGMARLQDPIGVYLCPFCHYYHFRNNDRAGNDDRFVHDRPMGKRGKGKKKPKRRICAFCFEGAAWAREKGQPLVPVAGKYLERDICTECFGLLRRGPEGRHKLVSAAEEAARIRAQESRVNG